MVSNLGTTRSQITSRTRKVLFTAAHSGFDLSRVPLGGAAAICARLEEEWGKQKPFPWRVLGPELLGGSAPRDKDLVRYSELQYAQFCRNFERVTTDEILRHDPRDVIVVCNDVSEGPTFRRLANRGYAIHTIYHVNVLDYFASIYLKGWVKTETWAAIYEKIHSSLLRYIVPPILKLIFQKQRDSLMYSRSVIVPSEGMKQTLLRSYPQVESDKIHVLPWGSVPVQTEETALKEKVHELRRRYGLSHATRVLLTLSRISPEKGQDLLLKALEKWTAGPLCVIIAGESAYMQGARFRLKLDKLAARLKNVQVYFPGYLAGLEKQAHFRLADLYVFPSRHESYGLTLLEALGAGLPAIATNHYGAEGLLQSDFGEMLPPAEESQVPDLLHDALSRLLANPSRLKKMGQRARVFAKQRTFAQTSQQLAAWITQTP
jgi:glycosyltransferase involved in cell wall biosynthesis